MLKKIAMAAFMLISTNVFALGGDVFISRITDTDNVLLSRSILTFHKDGTLIGSDSNQQGTEAFVPFGIEQGYWKKHDDVVRIKVVDFTYPRFITIDWPLGSVEDQQIAILTGELTKSGGSSSSSSSSESHYSGDLFISFFPLNADINDPTFPGSSGPFPAGHIDLTYIEKP